MEKSSCQRHDDFCFFCLLFLGHFTQPVVFDFAKLLIVDFQMTKDAGNDCVAGSVKGMYQFYA